MSGTFTPSHRGGTGPPLVLLHGITDTWRSWELALPMLEDRFEVLAPTMVGHAGGPPLDGELTEHALADGVERIMDEADWETAHFVGNSLGGFVSCQLAARGRAKTVTLLAPAGGWAVDDVASRDARTEYFRTAQELLKTAAAHADAIAASAEGRRRATAFITENYEHIPADLIAHQIAGAANAEFFLPLIEFGASNGFNLDAEKITCPARIVWGLEDKILPYPECAVRYKTEWLPNADFIELDGVGHLPQLDVPLETAELIAGFASS